MTTDRLRWRSAAEVQESEDPPPQPLGQVVARGAPVRSGCRGGVVVVGVVVVGFVVVGVVVGVVVVVVGVVDAVSADGDREVRSLGPQV